MKNSFRDCCQAWHFSMVSNFSNCDAERLIQAARNRSFEITEARVAP